MKPHLRIHYSLISGVRWWIVEAIGFDIRSTGTILSECVRSCLIRIQVWYTCKRLG